MNIALIGFMGTGKTEVAKRLAKKLGKKYVSTDELVVKKFGKPIKRIFEEDGEISFREAEIEVCKKVSALDNVIIDCGGGVVLNKINIDRLKKNSLIILLTASPETIAKRIAKKCKGKERPLLKGRNKLKKIKELLAFRKPFYDRAAMYKIDTTNLSIEEVVDRIMEIWENVGCSSKKRN